MKHFLFRVILGLIVIIGLETIGAIGMWINSRSFDIVSNKSYLQIRAMLRDDKNPEHFPRYLSLPYLGYIPFPGYKKYNIIQNNEDGYRGVKVPLQKTNKLRILCLGGSTTYGFAVDSPYKAFPAQLENMMAYYISQDSSLRKKYTGVEVINGGLEAGTSAEELQQYLFKYRYYRPDVVIIHSGVNDALLTARAPSDFQLDYTHYRRLNFSLAPLSAPGRWMLKSYFISFLSISLFYDNFAFSGDDGMQCFSRQRNQFFCKWSNVNMDSIISKRQYEFLPFYRNSKSLFSSITQDSALLVVFPNALNRKFKFVISNKEYDEMNSLNASLSRSLSDEFHGLYVPFAFDSIRDQSWWVDDCHVTAAGEKNKAEILQRALIGNLTRLTKSEN